ncbi:MAG TPA: hypothetical protein VN969_07020 [Streptosporangiaceae bacterium]|nr:hypothetical protein [Streptosporangiaceae bacterium]
MAYIVTAEESLDAHAVLDIERLDRIYLNAYVPVLQSSGQVVAFMTQHLGMPIPSSALTEKSGPGSAARWSRSRPAMASRGRISARATARSM